jgi:hypothetical protein
MKKEISLDNNLVTSIDFRIHGDDKGSPKLLMILDNPFPHDKCLTG